MISERKGEIKRESERERDGNISDENHWLAASCTLHSGDQAHMSMCPDKESNSNRLVHRLTLNHTGQAQFNIKQTASDIIYLGSAR